MGEPWKKLVKTCRETADLAEEVFADENIGNEGLSRALAESVTRTLKESQLLLLALASSVPELIPQEVRGAFLLAAGLSAIGRTEGKKGEDHGAGTGGERDPAAQ